MIDPKVLKLSDKGLEFVKDYEQPELKLYDAVPGKGDWTIGWGHKCTPEEVKKYKNSITIEQAEELLIKDLNEKIIPTSLQPFLVENNIKLTQNQYDALVSFTFNLGQYMWDRPAYHEDPNKAFDLKRVILEGNENGYYDAKLVRDTFMQYVGGSGVKLGGLYRRRADEADMFIDDDYKREDRSYPKGYK